MKNTIQHPLNWKWAILLVKEASLFGLNWLNYGQLCMYVSILTCTVSLPYAVTIKEDQKLVFNTDYRLVQVKDIAECSI